MGETVEIDAVEEAALIAAADSPGVPIVEGLNAERLYRLALHGIVTGPPVPALTKRGFGVVRQLKAMGPREPEASCDERSSTARGSKLVGDHLKDRVAEPTAKPEQ